MTHASAHALAHTYTATHTDTHTWPHAQTFHHPLIQTRLCDHVLGVDILWSERIGYTGSDLESDFSLREGQYIINGNMIEKVTQYSYAFSSCVVFLFCLINHRSIKRETQRGHGKMVIYRYSSTSHPLLPLTDSYLQV